MSKKVLSEDLICHGSSELSMHNFLSSLGTWQGVKNAMPWKEKKLGKKTTGKDYLKRCSIPSSGTKAKYRSIFQFYLWSVCKTRLRLLFPFSNHKKDHFPFPTMNILWEREVFEQNSVLFLVKKPQIIHECLIETNNTLCAHFLLVLDNLPSFHHIALFPSFV